MATLVADGLARLPLADFERTDLALGADFLGRFDGRFDANSAAREVVVMDYIFGWEAQMVVAQQN